MLIKGSRRYNLRHNTERTASPEVGRMINGQALGAVSKLRYGICRMSFNGCEVIAVHNALVYLGIPKPLTDIAFYMERFRVLMGFFGCNAYKLGKALKHFGAFIITFWTGRRLLSSVHTVFCIRKENGIEVYNRYNSSHGAELCVSMDEVAAKKKTIAVYSIEDLPQNP